MSRHPRLARALPWSFLALSLLGVGLIVWALAQGGACPAICSPLGCHRCPVVPLSGLIIGAGLIVAGPTLWAVTAQTRSDWGSRPLRRG